MIQKPRKESPNLVKCARMSVLVLLAFVPVNASAQTLPTLNSMPAHGTIAASGVFVSSTLTPTTYDANIGSIKFDFTISQTWHDAHGVPANELVEITSSTGIRSEVPIVPFCVKSGISTKTLKCTAYYNLSAAQRSEPNLTLSVRYFANGYVGPTLLTLYGRDLNLIVKQAPSTGTVSSGTGGTGLVGSGPNGGSAGTLSPGCFLMPTGGGGIVSGPPTLVCPPGTGTGTSGTGTGTSGIGSSTSGTGTSGTGTSGTGTGTSGTGGSILCTVQNNPMMPTTTNSGGGFVFTIPANMLCPSVFWIDPPIAKGYDYTVSGAAFAEVVLPDASVVNNPGAYRVSVRTARAILRQPVKAGGSLEFPLPQTSFSIGGISPTLNLDVINPAAFPTGVRLTNVTGGTVTITQTPRQ